MVKNAPTDTDRTEALRRILSVLARGDDVHEAASAVAELHSRNDTFPGEVFLRLACDALDLAGATMAAPIPYEGLLEKYLPECELRGSENRKFRFTVLAAAATRGGLDPDLLEEVSWWQTDDFWHYALLAAVAIIRSCADHMGADVGSLVRHLADRNGISL